MVKSSISDKGCEGKVSYTLKVHFKQNSHLHIVIVYSMDPWKKGAESATHNNLKQFRISGKVVGRFKSRGWPHFNAHGAHCTRSLNDPQIFSETRPSRQTRRLRYFSLIFVDFR